MTGALTTAWVSIDPLQRTWRLHLPPGRVPHALALSKKLTIRLGNWKKTLTVTQKRPSAAVIQSRIRIHPQSGSTPSIGPFVGILTVAGKGLFRGVQSNFIDIIEAGRKFGALIYVIPVENIDWKTLTVRGYLYHKTSNKWVKETLPMPHVMYNRIPNRAYEEQEHVKAALDRLAALPQITLYNPHFFNKRRLFTTLQRDPNVSSYLPQTVPLLSRESLFHMLDSHALVYAKPVNGMAGKGIYRLQKRSRTDFVLQYQLKKSTVTQMFTSRDMLWNFLSPRLTGPYLIQQGIHLATFHNKLFDIRLLAQKNGHGEWGVTGIGIRLAGSGRITTHVPRGGSIQSPSVIFPTAFPRSSPTELLKSIRRVALTIAHSLEKEWPTLGEVSMDIGIDKQERIWFIEANSKPGKFDEPHIRKLSLRRTIEYAQYQSRFIHSKGGLRRVHTQP
ncbi:YheC/D-like protein [Aneurinibacillus soli]|uniref:Endospore coat-associated protein YheD n=1 Tax=Aneurinibacillus soli TaxID=1500254 RepID=A0A0U5B0P2_9BACL|nr:YheC/YheD family protein [Aneurinibacillus soli]PYE59126.1 YheC/D-like protein [Aneurinibacillus soli]BAU29546.1 Endospore coat-associated protein YheD [Aneurinibacillus soli]